MNKQKLFVVLVMLPVVCSLFFSVGSVSGYDLELDDYAHYKVIAYEAGVGAGTDYQVVIVCHYGSGTDGTMSLNGETVALLHVGDIQADFDDVRFANQFGEILTHKRCSYTSAVNATFVVKVEADLDVDQLVYVYYGCGAAVDASSDNALVDIISNVITSLPLNEGAGVNCIDYSGSGNDGTINGATWAIGKFGNCLSFDGDDVVALTSALDLDLNDYSIVAWVKTASDVATRAVFAQGTVVSSWKRLGLFIGNDHVAWNYLYDGANENNIKGTSVVDDNSWKMLALTNDRSERMKVYVGSANENNTAVVTNDDPNLDKPGNIGASYENGGNLSFFTGSISNVFVVQGVLDGTEIANIASGYGDSTLEAGKVLVRKWASTTLPAVAGVSDVVDNVAFSPVVDGALTDTEWFVAGLILVLALVNIVLLVFPFALLRFVFGVLSFALSAWAFTYVGLPLAPYLQVMGLVVSVLGMFLATRARE